MPCAAGLNGDQYQGTLEKLERAQNGDARAREELVTENLALVHYVLRRFRDRNTEYDDLYQYGCMGLIKAVDRFDPGYGVRFSTYAVPIILGEVRRFLRDEGPVHVSRTIHDNALRVNRFREEYRRLHGCEADIDSICNELRLSRENVLLALNAHLRVKSLSEPVNPGGEIRIMDTLGRECMEEVDRRLTIARMLASLTPQERSLIIRRYFRRHTQSEIAQDMGVSQVQISRMEGKIIKRLRAQAEE